MIRVPGHSATIPLTGAGLALGFGWLWFPALRNSILPSLFEAPHAMNPLVFGLALGSCCLLYSLLADRLESGSPKGTMLNAIIAHGLPLALLGLFFLADWPGRSAGACMAGMSAALPGVWWISRLLALGPGKAATALVWASFAALAPALPLSVLHITPVAVLCTLSIGLVLACAAGLFLIRRENAVTEMSKAALADSLEPDAGLPQSFLKNSVLLPVGSLVALYFGIGSLNVFALAEGMLPAVVHACALAIAVVLLNRRSDSLDRRLPGRYLGLAACSLAVLACCLPFFPGGAFLLFPAGVALPEATALALCAALCRKYARVSGLSRQFKRSAPLAGLFLILTLAAVNGGFLVGIKLRDVADNAAPALPGLTAALLLGAVAYLERRNMTEDEPARLAGTSGSLESGREPAAMPAISAERKASIHPEMAGQLKERELALALLLVRGYSNKAAAEALNLSENTVRWYVKKLNRKTGAVDRAGLIAALSEN